MGCLKWDLGSLFFLLKRCESVLENNKSWFFFTAYGNNIGSKRVRFSATSFIPLRKMDKKQPITPVKKTYLKLAGFKKR